MKEFKTFLENQGLSERTINLYISNVELYLRENSLSDMRAWKQRESKRVSPNTLNSRIYALKKYCEFLGINCSIKSVSILLPEYLDSILTRAQYQKLINGLEQDKNYKYLSVVKLLAMTGLRISEAVQVTRKDIANRRMEVHCKGDKYRKVDFPKKLRDDILPYLGEGPVLTMKTGTLRSMLKEYGRKYGVPLEVMHPHEFRAFFARNVYEKTKDLRLVQGLLGHSNLKTTMRYLRASYKGVGRKLSRIVDW